MTFKHKLSVRLALLKDVLLLVPVTALLACERRLPLASGDPVVTRVTVSPSQLTLDTSQTSALMAVGLTATGDTGNIAMTWSATGGSIVDTFSSGSRHFANYHPSTPGTYRVIATGSPGGMADSSTVTVIQAAVVSVTVSPAGAAILVGATLQLTATPKDAAGNPLSGRVVTWASSNTAVASVSGSGLVLGQAAGSATITATSEGKSGTSAMTIQAPPPGPGFYVAPSGSPSGDGSITNPWDLQTALNQPAAVAPGSTIWMRGGRYPGMFASNLNGAAGNLVTVRQYPNERATIDGHLDINGSYAAFQGFEITQSTPPSGSATGVTFNSGTGDRIINLVIHDVSNQGVGFWNPSTGGEVYGCIVYNNGSHANFDHGIYFGNTAGSPLTQLVGDNIVFNNLTYNLHGYSSIAGQIANLTVDGNAAWGAGSLGGTSAVEILIAGVPAFGIRLTNNYTYEVSSSGNWAARIGAYTSSNQDVTIASNMFVGFAEVGPWSAATVSGNTFYSRGPVAGADLLSITTASGLSWSSNTHYRDPTAAAWGTTDIGGFTTFANWKTTTGLGASDTNPGTTPPGVRVIVRPNKYEASRANIVIYNWANAASVSVDLSTVLSVGQSFKIFNAQNFYGAPVVSGTYAGGTISIPMAGIPAPVPLRGSSGPVTGPTFQVFVVRLAGM